MKVTTFDGRVWQGQEAEAGPAPWKVMEDGWGRPHEGESGTAREVIDVEGVVVEERVEDRPERLLGTGAAEESSGK